MPHRLGRVCTVLLVGALCALHAWMAASVSRTFSTTSDEIAHLTAGYAYWTQNDYRLQPENGNLPQRLAALPLLLQKPAFPEPSGPLWEEADVWQIGTDFFHRRGNDLPAMLAAGRSMIALLSALLCLLVYIWTRSLFGHRAALLALTLAAFCPNLLAHGGLATSDTAAALGFALATLAWWRLLHKISPGRVLAAGLAAGFLAISKYSVVLLAPIAAILLIVRLARPAPLALVWGRRIFPIAGPARVPILAGVSIAAMLLSVFVIWSAYGFRYSAAPPGAPAHAGFVIPWDNILLKDAGEKKIIPRDERGVESTDPKPGVVQFAVEFFRDHRLLPEAWLYGLAFVEKNARGRLAFFAGEYRTTGWREFFPAAFMLKTTLPALALIVIGLAGLATTPVRRRRVLVYHLAPLLTLLAVYWAFSLQSRLNIGHRHLLPTYAACYVLAGAGVLLARRRRVFGPVIGALAIWHACASLAIRPDYLAYFNPLAGGPANAHRIFVDSSLDWGQDLPRLKDWIGANAGDEPVFLSYFGSGNPRHAGIQAVRVGDGYFDWEPRRTPPPLTGGVYCLSATMFRRVYTEVRGPWSQDYETAYQKLGSWLDHMARQPRDVPPSDVDGSPLDTSAVHERLQTYEQFQFGRLCHFLQERDPDARVGYSFLIFRLSDAEVTLALNAPLPLLDQLIKSRSGR